MLTILQNPLQTHQHLSVHTSQQSPPQQHYNWPHQRRATPLQTVMLWPCRIQPPKTTLYTISMTEDIHLKSSKKPSKLQPTQPNTTEHPHLGKSIHYDARMQHPKQTLMENFHLLQREPATFPLSKNARLVECKKYPNLGKKITRSPPDTDTIKSANPKYNQVLPHSTSPQPMSKEKLHCMHINDHDQHLQMHSYKPQKLY